MKNELEGIRASIDELAKRAGISRNRAFAAWYGITFYDLDEDDALEGAAADGGNDQGIDIVFADDSSQEIVVLQAYCPDAATKITPKAKWDAVTASLPFVQVPASLGKAGRPDLGESLEALKKGHPDYSITVGLVSLGLKSNAIEHALAALERAGNYKEINFFYFSQESILANYKSVIEAESGIPEDELSFCDNYFEDSGEYGRAWVGSVSAVELRRLHDKHRAKLFAGNIRLYLGSRKGGINEQIIRTATVSPGLFWALNNGITIVADNAIPIKSGKKNISKLNLKRFSIVNGCQTTSSLVRAPETSTAKVLARVISAKTGLKNDIVRFNNSQNAVKIWAVRAADDIQEQLRREFDSVSISYAPKQEGSRQKRDLKIIQLDKVAQYLASADQEFLPLAINNKSELFDEPYQRIFKKGIKAERVYLAWLLGNCAESQRQVRVTDLGQADSNVGLLGVASVLWITYCCFKLINKFSDVESGQITLKKMLRTEFMNALKKYVDAAIDIFYDAAIDTYDRAEYGSFKSTLRSVKFLGKIDSKVNNKISRLPSRKLPDFAVVAKSISAR